MRFQRCRRCRLGAWRTCRLREDANRDRKGAAAAKLDLQPGTTVLKKHQGVALLKTQPNAPKITSELVRLLDEELP
jgi:hypothetical protein